MHECGGDFAWEELLKDDLCSPWFLHSTWLTGSWNLQDKDMGFQGLFVPQKLSYMSFLAHTGAQKPNLTHIIWWFRWASSYLRSWFYGISTFTFEGLVIKHQHQKTSRTTKQMWLINIHTYNNVNKTAKHRVFQWLRQTNINYLSPHIATKPCDCRTPARRRGSLQKRRPTGNFLPG